MYNRPVKILEYGDTFDNCIDSELERELSMQNDWGEDWGDELTQEEELDLLLTIITPE